MFGTAVRSNAEPGRFRGSGSRVVSRITIERFRLSSEAKLNGCTSPLPEQARSLSQCVRSARASRHLAVTALSSLAIRPLRAAQTPWSGAYRSPPACATSSCSGLTAVGASRTARLVRFAARRHTRNRPRDHPRPPGERPRPVPADPAGGGVEAGQGLLRRAGVGRTVQAVQVLPERLRLAGRAVSPWLRRTSRIACTEGGLPTDRAL